MWWCLRLCSCLCLCLCVDMLADVFGCFGVAGWHDRPPLCRTEWPHREHRVPGRSQGSGRHPRQSMCLCLCVDMFSDMVGVTLTACDSLPLPLAGRPNRRRASPRRRQDVSLRLGLGEGRCIWHPPGPSPQPKPELRSNVDPPLRNICSDSY